MRTALLCLLAGLTVAAAAPSGPSNIVFARVFPQPGQLGLFTAAADGADEHPLLAARDADYDPTWSPDGASIVFTSEREGSADLYRVAADGSGLLRLTESAAYDDQAAFSPDGKQLVFVSTRSGGTADLWTMDLQTRRARSLTSGPGGDFRPSWSPDGAWIAFSSDRGSTMPFGHGRWERLQLADIYLIHPDGSGLKRLSAHGNFCGSPKWTADSRRVIAYCMTAEYTLDARRPVPEHPEDTRIVAFDVATGSSSDLPSGPGVKFNPSVLPGNQVAYLRKGSGDVSGVYYANGTRGPKGDVRTASWSPDGKRVVFHKRLPAVAPTWKKIWSRNADYGMTLTSILPSFNTAGDRFAMTTRPVPGTVLGAALAVADAGTDKATVIYQDKTRNVLAPQWSPNGDTIIFGVGVYNLFFNGFHGLIEKPGDRIEGGAQIATIRADGTGYREVTSDANNNGFPSMAPDGKRFVYRSFGADGEGLRIMNLESHAVTTLTSGYDNFPLWSPRGDLIMFSRHAQGDYQIYTVKPDGTGVKRLTYTRGTDAHQAWSADGEHIVFASSRMGFKDELTYTDAPQPYGELFVMRYDGSNVEQLTDNQWEEGTPAWQPAPKQLSRK
jgi:TolB protein